MNVLYLSPDTVFAKAQQWVEKNWRRSQKKNSCHECKLLHAENNPISLDSVFGNLLSISELKVLCPSREDIRMRRTEGNCCCNMKFICTLSIIGKCFISQHSSLTRGSFNLLAMDDHTAICDANLWMFFRANIFLLEYLFVSLLIQIQKLSDINSTQHSIFSQELNFLLHNCSAYFCSKKSVQITSFQFSFSFSVAIM